MKIKMICPWCGSEEFVAFDSEDRVFEHIDFCYCENCDQIFRTIYTLNRIEKDNLER